MVNNIGWIKIHRSLLDWEWYTDTNCKVLFVHFLLTSNIKDKKWRGLSISKGARVTGRIQLSSETGLSEQQVRTALKKLLLTKELTIKKTSLGTIYTVVNWKKYQVATTEQPEINHEPTRDQPETNQRPTTTKEDNNINNKKNNTGNDELTTTTKEIKNIDVVYTVVEFIKDWNIQRKKHLDKPSFLNRLGNDELINFNDLAKDYKGDDFNHALIGLFKQKKLPNGNTSMQSNPKHFLTHFNSYLTAYHDKNSSLYGKETNHAQTF